jgi:hypothetical protein
MERADRSNDVGEGAVASKGLDPLELVAAIALSIAAVATAWSGFQASRWNGEQAVASSHANATRIAAARAEGEARTNLQIDIETFVQWVDARAVGKESLAQFYERRFRPEFEPAFDAWIATRPLRNPSAPPTPFTMPEYQPAAETEADQLGEQADAYSEDMRRDIQRATNYVLAVVLFSVSLFFAAISTRLSSRRLRVVLLTMGCVALVGTCIWVAVSPVNFSI